MNKNNKFILNQKDSRSRLSVEGIMIRLLWVVWSRELLPACALSVAVSMWNNSSVSWNYQYSVVLTIVQSPHLWQDYINMYLGDPKMMAGSWGEGLCSRYRSSSHTSYRADPRSPNWVIVTCVRVLGKSVNFLPRSPLRRAVVFRNVVGHKMAAVPLRWILKTEPEELQPQRQTPPPIAKGMLVSDAPR